MILLDTCALLWWTLEPSMLSNAAKKACNRIVDTGAVVSTISVWEIGIKLKKGTLRMPETLHGYVNRLRLMESLEILAINETIWVECVDLDWDHKDPADRTIVATARLRNLPIVTKDPRIASYYGRIIW